MDVPRLHPDTLDQVRQRADLVEVVASHVVLRRQGKDLVGLCPFHEDRNPSLHVSPHKQLYHCFSCGAGGDVIKFLTEIKKTSFSEAVLDLAQRYQVPIRTLAPEQQQQLQRQLTQRQQLYEILALASHFYAFALEQPTATAVRDYVTQTRGLTPETIRDFQLGYAPPGWQTLYTYLVEQKSYPLDLVVKAGLLVPRPDGGCYDRFRNRLIIPIRDGQGRVVGFGGRSLDGEDPKYLNSPETELFNKGHLLFGLDRAKEAIVRADQTVVVEGYFDAIALHQAGLRQVVAVLGTALSAAQVKILLRYTDSKQIVLNFDADSAGRRAVARGLGEVENLAFTGQVHIRVLELPAGMDAAEFLQHQGIAAYRHLLEHSPLWIEWQIEQILAQRDPQRPDQFQELLQALAKLLQRLPNPAVQAHYARTCVNALGQGNSRLIVQLEGHLARLLRNPKPLSRPLATVTPTNLLEAAEAQLLRVYLHCPAYQQTVIDGLEEWDLAFCSAPYRWLWQWLQSHPAAHAPDQGALQEALTEADLSQESTQKLLGLIYLDEMAERELHQPSLVVQSAIATLARVIRGKHYRHLLHLWQERSLLLAETRDSVAQQALLEELQRLQASITSEKNYLEGLDRQRCLHPWRPAGPPITEVLEEEESDPAWPTATVEFAEDTTALLPPDPWPHGTQR